MARKISTVILDTAHILQKVTTGEFSSSQGMDMLSKLAVKTETVADRHFIRIANESIMEWDQKMETLAIR
jgi:hypothetical protein